MFTSERDPCPTTSASCDYTGMPERQHLGIGNVSAESAADDSLPCSSNAEFHDTPILGHH